jgi:hypothetical protein
VPLTIAEYTPETFTSRIGECFRFITADERAPRGIEMNLTLLESRSPKQTDTSERKPFSLLFATPEDIRFLQGLCLLQHPDFVNEHVFLTRILPPRATAPQSYRSYYEAIFG